MKKIICWLIGVISCITVAAQQQPHYTQYILNQYILNPALTGIENYTDIKISHRHQWSGIQDAPVTTYFTIHTPLHKDDYRITATSFSLPGENPRGKAYWESYTPAAAHQGIGAQVINDHAGPLNRFAAYLTYAWHVGISPTTNLAAGVGAGFANLRLEADKLLFNTQVDPVVYNSSEIRTTKPDFNAGLYLYSASYFIGIAAQQLVPQDIEFSDNTVKTSSGQLVPHWFATMGYRFLWGEDFNLIPSVLLKYVKPLPVQADLNLKLQYLDRAWIGASYRTYDGFAAMAGLYVSNKFNIGYAYDYTITTLNTYSHGTHEIVVGLVLGNRYSDACPRNVW